MQLKMTAKAVAAAFVKSDGFTVLKESLVDGMFCTKNNVK